MVEGNNDPAGRRFRLINVILLIFLSVQGWTGDTVNLFASYPYTSPVSMSGFLWQLGSATGVGPALIWHALEALIILALSVTLVIMALKRRLKGIAITCVLGIMAVISAMIGGMMFVMSGFTQDGFSAQMGGSFIGTYALFFVTLYFSKPA